MEPAILLDPVILRDSIGAMVNPASEESNLLLRRILKVLESNSIVDNKQRQKVVIDAVGNSNSPASTEVGSALPITGNMGTAITAGGSTITLSPTLGTVVYQAVWEGPVDQRWRVTEDSHVSYQLGIRSKLAFS